MHFRYALFGWSHSKRAMKNTFILHVSEGMLSDTISARTLILAWHHSHDNSPVSITIQCKPQGAAV